MRKIRTYQDVTHDTGSGLLEQVVDQQQRLANRLAQVRSVVAIASGKGGVGKSAITANLAADAGKEVFAIPGNIKHPLTEGPHYLIQQGAKLTTCVADMLEELGIELADACYEEAARQQGLAFESASGLLAHVDTEFTSVDDLAARSGLSVSQVMADMLEYELVGKVSAVPGGYVRVS